jgi:hypothetical protein
MKSITLLAVLLVSCGQYYTVQPNVKIQRARFFGNVCDGSKGAQVAEVIALIHEKALALNIVKRWPPAPISVCIASQVPYVQCGSVRLGGCAWPDRVFVPVQLAVKLGEARLRRDYQWRNQLAHEMLGALALQGAIDLPHDEPSLIAHLDYHAILKHVRTELGL